MHVQSYDVNKQLYGKSYKNKLYNNNVKYNFQECTILSKLGSMQAYITHMPGRI